MPLTSVRLLALLIAACVAALVVVVLARRVWPRRPVATRVIASVALLVLGAATAGDAVNRHFGLYRGWGDLLGVHSRDLVNASTPSSLARAVAPLSPGAPHPTHGTLLQLRIPGPVSGVAPRSAYVYLPPQYRDPAYAGQSFPVVEAFQGSPGRPSDWILGVRADQELDRGIGRGLVAPTIVVFPDTNGGLARSLECTNTADGIADETFLTSDVRTWVTSHLRTGPGRWVAAGYSTGGYCAISLAFRHPELFSRSISLDGYAHALDDGYARGLWHSDADRLAHSPDWWVAHHGPQQVDVYLLAGTLDAGAARDTLAFWKELGNTNWLRPYDALVAQRNGTHTFPDWQAALLPALSWALPGVRSPHFSAAPDVAALRPQPGITALGSCPPGFATLLVPGAHPAVNRRTGRSVPYVRCLPRRTPGTASPGPPVATRSPSVLSGASSQPTSQPGAVRHVRHSSASPSAHPSHTPSPSRAPTSSPPGATP